MYCYAIANDLRGWVCSGISTTIAHCASSVHAPQSKEIWAMGWDEMSAAGIAAIQRNAKAGCGRKEQRGERGSFVSKFLKFN